MATELTPIVPVPATYDAQGRLNPPVGGINSNNIQDYFYDYIGKVANTGIVWGTNSLPFPEMPTAIFGGPRTGRPVDRTYRPGNPGAVINAKTIYDQTLADTAKYTAMTSLRAQKVLGGVGSVYNAIGKAYMSSAFELQAGNAKKTGLIQFYFISGTVGSPTYPRVSNVPGFGYNTYPGNDGGVISNTVIYRSDFLYFRQSLYAWWLQSQNVTWYQRVDVCHTSCHGNCHGSRIRR